MEKEMLEKETGAQEQNQGHQASLNVWQRLVGVLTNPRQTFTDIVAHPHFVAGLVVICAVNLLAAFLILPNVRAFTLWTMEQQTAQMPPGAAMAMEMASTGAMFGVVFASVVGPLFFFLLMAVLLFFFGYIVKGQSSFRTLFAVSVFAYVPATIASVIQSALIASRPAENLKSVTTSLAMFLPAGSEGLPSPGFIPDRPFGSLVTGPGRPWRSGCLQNGVRKNGSLYLCSVADLRSGDRGHSLLFTKGGRGILNN